MNEERAESRRTATATGQETDRRMRPLWWATWTGLILCAVGLVDGVLMALNRKVVTCPDGTYFPEGTKNFDCYAHPQGGVGIAVAVWSVVLAILVVMSSVVAEASIGRGRQPD